MPGMGARAHRYQQGLFRIAEGFAGDLLQLLQRRQNLGLDLFRQRTAVVIIAGAGLGGYGKALGHRHTQIGHFRQIGAFAAQQFAHSSIAFGKEIDVLFAHEQFLLIDLARARAACAGTRQSPESRPGGRLVLL